MAAEGGGSVDEIARELVNKIHSMNNAWQVVLGGLEMAHEHTSDEVLLARLERLIRSARAGGALGREAVTLATQLASRRSEVDLNALVREVAADCQDMLGPAFRLTINVATEPLWANINPVGFAEVIQNLAANTRDAMPAGGTFTLSVMTVDDGRLVCIVAQDDGPGMGPTVAERCFDQFFTTKGLKGTGLGLAMVKQFVTAHRGRIRLDTGPGKGARFELCFPRELAGVASPDVTA